MSNRATIETNSETIESLATVIGRVAGVIGHEEFPTGDRAALKRMSPSSHPPLAFFRFAFRHLPNGWEFRKQAWMTIVAGISLMSPHAHRPDIPVGQALANSGYSEARLERLLASEKSILHTLVLRAARFLRAKLQPMNWTGIARLLLTGETGKREDARIRIASYYYRNLRIKE